jgi:hypothetical protein
MATHSEETGRMQENSSRGTDSQVNGRSGSTLLFSRYALQTVRHSMKLWS